MSLDNLIEKIVAKQNPTVVGLDPLLDFVPNYIKQKYFKKYSKSLKAAAKSILKFNKGIIDEICEVVPAIKPQSAYYEMYGYHGVKSLYKTIEYAKQKGMYVIVDGKRNDIGSTMDAYSTAYLGKTQVEGNFIPAFDGDSLTVNGYLGSDSIKSIIKTCKQHDKGVFVLIKTSNESSSELQDLLVGEKPIYQIMGELCEKFGNDLEGKYGYSGVGGVVGATHPEQLCELRKKLKKTFFLVPGYGAQGGSCESIKASFDKNGLGAIINSSRAIMCAYKNNNVDEKKYAKAALEEALDMKSKIIESIGHIKLP